MEPLRAIPHIALSSSVCHPRYFAFNHSRSDYFAIYSSRFCFLLLVWFTFSSRILPDVNRALLLFCFSLIAHATGRRGFPMVRHVLVTRSPNVRRSLPLVLLVSVQFTEDDRIIVSYLKTRKCEEKKLNSNDFLKSFIISFKFTTK